MASDHCAGVATDLVRRTQLGDDSWALRGRTRGPGVGDVSSFGGNHALTVNRPFAERLDQWALNLNHWTYTYPSSSGRKFIAWIGEVGALACHRPTAAHNRGRGLDLCHIRFTDGDFVDMNTSHRSSGLHQRRYLAVAANLRRFFGTVLTVHYNSAHRDHIHVDDLTAVAPIRTDKRTDTTLVQSAANLLNGTNIAVDGIWGSNTQAAYVQLLQEFGLSCTDPTRSVAAAQTFLAYVVITATADARAGTYRSDACMPKDPCANPSDLLKQLECGTDDLLDGLG